jgi:hypothetical protein
MKFLTLSFAVLFITAPAFAEVIAHELDGNDLRIPISDAGSISYRECSSCEFGRARIASDALFLLNESTTSLDQIRQALAQTANKSKAMITLFYDDDSKRVTRIAVRIR